LPRVQRYASHLEEKLDRGESVDVPFDPADSDKPVWDPESRSLYFEGELVRKLRLYKGSKIPALLDAFAELGWPRRIDDPVYGKGQADSAKRDDLIDSLNSGIKRIRFGVDGEGYYWAVLGQG